MFLFFFNLLLNYTCLYFLNFYFSSTSFYIVLLCIFLNVVVGAAFTLSTRRDTEKQSQMLLYAQTYLANRADSDCIVTFTYVKDPSISSTTNNCVLEL